jgi:hypothetical protein
LKCNVGPTERVIRMIAGTVILLFGLAYRSWWGLIGLAPLITGIIGWCPASRLLGISTCENEEKNQS